MKKEVGIIIDHPSYYTDGIEVIDFIEDRGCLFSLGNAIKYICRAGKKNSDTYVEDLKKAIWYLNRILEKGRKIRAKSSWRYRLSDFLEGKDLSDNLMSAIEWLDAASDEYLTVERTPVKKAIECIEAEIDRLERGDAV